jgi:hypothetical protein
MEHSLPVFADDLVSGCSYRGAQHTIRFPSFFHIEWTAERPIPCGLSLVVLNNAPSAPQAIPGEYFCTRTASSFIKNMINTYSETSNLCAYFKLLSKHL